MGERMRHGPTEGYIVMWSGGPLKLTRYPGSRKPILAHARLATLFATREEAKRAVLRTRDYAFERGYTNPMWTEHYIVRAARPAGTTTEGARDGR
jgi:hypothetical protein